MMCASFFIPRSIVAVPTCQCLIQLQRGLRYLISVRAVNVGGPSDRSKVVAISTTGRKARQVCFCSIFQQGTESVLLEEDLEIKAALLLCTNMHFYMWKCHSNFYANHLLFLLVHYWYTMLLVFVTMSCVLMDGNLHMPFASLYRYIFLPPGGQCTSLPVHLGRRLYHILWWWGTAN